MRSGRVRKAATPDQREAVLRESTLDRVVIPTAKTLGRQVRNLRGELKDLRMPHLEGSGVVELGHLFLDRLNDARTAVARIDAPEPGDRVQHLAPVRGPEMNSLRRGEQARCRLELAIRGERHPVGAKVVRRGGKGGAV